MFRIASQARYMARCSYIERGGDATSARVPQSMGLQSRRDQPAGQCRGVCNENNIALDRMNSSASSETNHGYDCVEELAVQNH